MTTQNLFTNRATAKIAVDVSSGDTAITLVPGGGEWFPAPAANQFFRLVLQKGSGQTDQREYMVCTGRAGDVLTVTRAQEGTPAANFTVGDEVSLVATAATMTSMVQRVGPTLQGALEVEAPPTTPLGITNKQYLEENSVPDAPADGNEYVRKDAAWVLSGGQGGGSSPTANYMYNAEPVAGDPGSQRIGTDTGVPATATKLAISKLTKNGQDASGFLQAIAQGSVIYVWALRDTSEFATYTATGAPVDSPTYVTVPIKTNGAQGAEPADYADVGASFTFGLSGNTTTINDLAPANPIYGDRWIRPEDMSEKVWVPNAGNSGVWIEPNSGGSEPYPLAISKGGTGATTAAQARINLGLDGTIPWMLQDGTVAAPGLAWASEPGLGLHRRAASIIGIAAAGVDFMVADATSATNTTVSVASRSAGGIAVLSLGNNTIGSANRNLVQLLQDAGTGAILRTVAQGTAVRGNLTIDAPVTNMSTINAGAIVGATLSIAPGVTQSQDATYVYDQYGVNWYWAFNKTTGDLQWTRGGANPATILQANGSFVTGGKTLIVGPYTDLFGLLQDSTNWYWRMNAVTNLSVGIASGDMTYSVNNQWAFSSKASGDFWIRGQAYKPGGGAWGDGSDERIKENIEPYTSGLDQILALKPVRFTFKTATGRDTTKRYIRLIAQQAKTAMPELVTIKAGKVGDMEFDDLHELDESPVLWALVNSVHTLHQRITQLETT